MTENNNQGTGWSTRLSCRFKSARAGGGHGYLNKNMKGTILLLLVLISFFFLPLISFNASKSNSNAFHSNFNDNENGLKEIIYNDNFHLGTSSSNILSSSYFSVTEGDNLEENRPYWFNASVYDNSNWTRDFQSGVFQLEDAAFGNVYNHSLSSLDNSENYDESDFEYTMNNGSRNGNEFQADQITFDYNYLRNSEYNYNYSMYNQEFTAADGSMSHTYLPDGYNSSYSFGDGLTMYNEFPSEYHYDNFTYWDFDYNSEFTNSNFSKYSYVTNASFLDGNGEWVSGGLDELKYNDDQYYIAKSKEILGDDILYLDLDWSGMDTWDHLDGDYLLFFSCNETMTFRDGNFELLWEGSEAFGVGLQDIDDYIYIHHDHVGSDPFSIQIDYLYLLEPVLYSKLNVVNKSFVPSQPNDFTFYNGTYNDTNYGDLHEIDGNFSTINSTTYYSSGTYLGYYSFTDDTVGQNPAGWTCTETGGTTNIDSTIDGHSMVLDYDDTSTSNRPELLNEFSDQSSGTIEWHGRLSSTTGIVYHKIRDDSDSHSIYLQFYNGMLRYRDDSTYYNIMSYSANTWYHFRIEFDCSGSTFDLWINDDYKGAFSDRGTPSQMDDMNIHTDSLSQIHYYIDAVDYSWAPGYYLNRNQDTAAVNPPTLNLKSLFQFNFDGKHDNDTIDFIRLYYTFHYKK